VTFFLESLIAASHSVPKHSTRTLLLMAASHFVPKHSTRSLLLIALSHSVPNILSGTSNWLLYLTLCLNILSGTSYWLQYLTVPNILSGTSYWLQYLTLCLNIYIVLILIFERPLPQSYIPNPNSVTERLVIVREKRGAASAPPVLHIRLAISHMFASFPSVVVK